MESEAPTDDVAMRDIDFHLAIADASGNRLLYDLLFDLNAYVQQTRKLVLTRGLVPQHRPQRHRGRDPRQETPIVRRRAAATHMNHVRAAIIEGISAQADEPAA